MYGSTGPQILIQIPSFNYSNQKNVHPTYHLHVKAALSSQDN